MLPQAPEDVLRAILADPTNRDTVGALMASDATDVSLDLCNPASERVIPWAGTATGPAAAAVRTFVDMGRDRTKGAFGEIAPFGDDRHAAVLGRMTDRSVILGKQVTSPFAVFVEVVDGPCRHMPFMKDTRATSEPFRGGGAWTIRSDPAGGQITL